MEREYHHWHSPALDREMELLIFGRGGKPVLVFPTSKGRFYQYEDFQMIETLRPYLEQGRIQVFCVDSVDEESWYATNKPPHDRAARHNQYELYIQQEAVPFIQQRTGTQSLTITGNSFGAYHGVNFTLKHPELVDRVIAISGAYRVPGPLNNYYDDDIYFNEPIAYLPNLEDDRYLIPLRQSVDMRLIVGGSADICHKSTVQLADIMKRKQLPHTLDIWEPAWHDWPWWQQMILKHI